MRGEPVIYDWKAALTVFIVVVAVSVIGKFLVFRIPALQRMREYNREQDKTKLAKAKYPPVVKGNNRIGAATNAAFFLLIIPMTTSLAAQPVWLILLDIVAILMVYDFFYYLTHRFLFHGQGYLRRVHALHHQARKPTYIDAFYVHPVELFIGIALFMGTVALLYPVLGTYNVAAVTIVYLVFVHLNTINHAFVDLPYSPFRTLTWITKKHHVHHIDMHKGNYATITLLYDKLFGTLD